MESILRTLLLILILCCNNVFAQSPYFKNYTVKDGLPSDETYEVFQDSKSYIWIATDKGVARFDGYEFKIFTKKDGLSDNTVFGFYEDLKGRIWFRSYNGKLCYFLNDKFTTLKCSDSFSGQIKNNTITSFYVDKNEKLWIGLTYSEPYFVDIKNETFVKQKIAQIASKSVYVIEIENDFIWGNTWIENNPDKKNNYSLYLLNNENKPITKIDLSASKTESSNYYSNVIKKGSDYYYLLTNNIFKFGQKGIDSILAFEANLFSLYKNKDILMLGNEKTGVNFKNGQSDFLNFLPGNSITSIIRDKEESFWFSSLNKGIFYTPTLNITDYPLNSEYKDEVVNCISVDSNEIWIGLQNGILLNKKKSKKIEKITFNNNKTLDKTANINQLKNNTIGISSINSLIIKDSKTHFFNAEGWSKIYSKDIFYIEDSYYLLGKNKIYVCDNKNYKEKTRINLNTIINGGFYDGKNIWIATHDGLWSLIGNRPVKIKAENNDISFRIDVITGDKKGNLYLASNGNGLFLLKRQMLYGLYISNQDGFYKSLCVGDDNAIWTASNKGLSKIKFSSFDPLNYIVYNFSESQGLPSNKINQIKENNKVVYLATDRGITTINDKNYFRNNTKPPIYLTKIEVNDSNYNLKTNYQLAYNENNFKINYIGLTYKDAGNTDYKYRLLGLDSGWTYTKYTSANYTTLPYGVYTFEVLAKNNDGYWSEKPAKISFTIAPPFWHTWWFRIITGISLMAGLLYFTRARIKVIEKREMDKTAVFKKTAEMEKEKAELYQKAADMELKFLSSQMNPHFTFNSMNSIQYFLMNNETEKAQRYLVKYSKLIRLVLENNMQSLVLLEDEIKMLTLYMQIEALRFVEKFEFEILISDDLKEKKIKIPPMVIQPYVENAIWHGLMNKTNGAGKIMLSFSAMEDMLKCTIEDNGIGRKRAKEMSKPKEYQSLGMLITSARLEKMHATSIKNKINIIDKKDQEENACGTIVELLFPFNNE